MNERGVALPTAMIMLAVLTALTVAFVTLATTEPTIANNQRASIQARALAESGVERAIWALNAGEGAAPDGSIPDPMPGSPLPSPQYDAYNGVAFTQVSSLGGFVVTVTQGGAPNERIVKSVGYTPNNVNPVARRTIQAVLTRPPFGTPPGTPLCALCVGGEVPEGDTALTQIGGNAFINASTSGSPAAVYCAGQTPTSAFATTGTLQTNGTPSIVAPTDGVAALQNQPPSSFAGFTLSDADMSLLKAMAQASGPGHYYQGNQTFTSPPPNGIIFVDTPSGASLTNSSPSSDLISVDIHGNWSSGWSGWLIVAGSVRIQGNISMTGLIYAQNDADIHGNGNMSISGAIIAQDRVDSSATTVDSDDVGNGKLAYNCPAIRNGGGSVAVSWLVKPGSYREVSGQ